LVDKLGRVFGEPEDYDIWEGHMKLARPLIIGLECEIVSRFTPGPPRIQLRRGSMDFGNPTFPTPVIPNGPQPRAFEWPPPAAARTGEPAREVPPQWMVQVIYQAHDAPEKEWRSWFTAEDTEYSIEKRARNVLGILG
jgi:hypothetical protein